DENDIYIPRVAWPKDPNVLSVRKSNRLQNRVDLLHVDASTGKSNIVLTEQSDTYVDIEAVDDLVYLKDGKSFIMPSERSGNKHLYLFGIDGKLIQQITQGNFDVVSFIGIDEKTGLV